MLRLLSNLRVTSVVLTPHPETVVLVKRSLADHPHGSDRQPSGAAVVVERQRQVWPCRRSPQTTNTERRLADLECAVVNGLMTAGEADRVFGCKPAGTGGRRRKAGQEDFASWLRTRIRKLSDPAALAALVDEARRLQSDRKPGRAARVRALNRRISECDPAYVARLCGALNELYEGLTVSRKAAERRQADRAARLRQKLRAAA